jgi:dTDP-4-dehydrorhamnose 3,5-epimerase
MMDVKRVEIEGLLVITPRVFSDERGYFFESYQKKVLNEHGIDTDFLQDNESCSAEGVLRGLHFQAPPYDQGKLVRVVKGKVLDVAVDLRRNSATYGQHFSIELSGENKLLFWIPPGFAHGFISKEKDTIFTYKCTQLYHKDSERCLLWDDPTLNIQWGHTHPIVSEKDREGSLFENFVSPF